MIRFFDAHCHLQDERLRPSLPDILARAERAGVQRLACNGTSEEDWPAVRDLCARHPHLIPSFGLHPWYVRGRSPRWLDSLRELLDAVPAAGIGEIGLDHAVKERNDSDQLDVFLAQLRLAAKLGRPASIHCRKAWETLVETLRRAGPIPTGFVIHSYSGPLDRVAPLAALGARFSFSGAITFSGNRKGRAAAAAVPADRLLVETDTPDLPPVINGVAPAPGRLSEPALIVHPAAALADIRNIPLEQVADQTWDNACRLFTP